MIFKEFQTSSYIQQDMSMEVRTECIYIYITFSHWQTLLSKATYIVFREMYFYPYNGSQW